MTTIAITGATGFVGGALSRALSAQGHKIVALARQTSHQDHLAGLNIDWVSGDVTSRDSPRGKFDGADWLIHAAGMLGRAGVSERAYFDLHERGTNNVLAEAETSGVERILYVSSPGVLGPISGPPADEGASLAPSNPYERSKAAAEQVVQVYAQGGLPVVISRPEFIYGPGDLHVLGLFRAVRDGRFFTINGGHNTCHPTYIDDAVSGMLLALKKGRIGETYHITGPEPVTFRELGATIAAALDAPLPKWDVPKPLAMMGATALEMLAKITRYPPPLSRTGVKFFSEDRRFSWEKANQELGYSPQFDLKSGVAATVAWYQEHDLL